MQSLIVASDAKTMSSREIADLVEARHNDVVSTIERLFEKGLLRSNRKSRREATGGRPIEVYDLIERDTHLVVAGYSDEHRARVIDRWQELEAKPKELSRLELLQIALAAEQEKIQIAAERDHAIATKAQIGSKREATAMAKASAAVREVNRLKDELGCNARHATIIAVERATGSKLPRNAYVSLRRWCRDNGVEPTSVVDPRYGSVKAWPAAAWMATHGIDLSSFFKGEGVAA